MKLWSKIAGGGQQKDPNSLVGKCVQCSSFNLTCEECVGSGGYASIYRTRDQVSGQTYALKHMRLPADSDSVAEVRQEMKIMHLLGNHPNILKLHAASFAGPAGKETDAFMVLDYCPNTLLDMMQRANFQLDEFFVHEVFSEVCHGVAHMHMFSPPYAHRDIKAENVLKTSKGKWVLCDFGSASTKAQVFESPAEIAMEEEVIRRTTTPAYRAPEMWDLMSRHRIDTKADIWALGVLLYVLTFGKLPFQGDSKLSVLFGKYEMPPGKPQPVCDLIRELLTPDPAQRPDILAVLSRLETVKAHLLATVGGGVPPSLPSATATAPVASAVGAGVANARAQQPAGAAGAPTNHHAARTHHHGRSHVAGVPQTSAASVPNQVPNGTHHAPAGVMRSGGSAPLAASPLHAAAATAPPAPGLQRSAQISGAPGSAANAGPPPAAPPARVQAAQSATTTARSQPSVAAKGSLFVPHEGALALPGGSGPLAAALSHTSGISPALLPPPPPPPKQEPETATLIDVDADSPARPQPPQPAPPAAQEAVDQSLLGHVSPTKAGKHGKHGGLHVGHMRSASFAAFDSSSTAFEPDWGDQPAFGDAPSAASKATVAPHGPGAHAPAPAHAPHAPQSGMSHRLSDGVASGGGVTPGGVSGRVSPHHTRSHSRSGEPTPDAAALTGQPAAGAGGSLELDALRVQVKGLVATHNALAFRVKQLEELVASQGTVIASLQQELTVSRSVASATTRGLSNTQGSAPGARPDGRAPSDAAGGASWQAFNH